MTEFDLTFPPEEAALVTRHYSEADVILEYGSGGSTVLASAMAGKLIFSVESDKLWAERLQRHIDETGLASPAIVFPVDIGPTARWGRPIDESGWRSYHRYPAAIWTEPFFRHPDVVLIDGRFRPACMAMTCLMISRPVTLLFDDYATRPAYSVVERFARPTRVVGRMAEFALDPARYDKAMIPMLLSLASRVSLAGTRIDYTTIRPI